MIVYSVVYNVVQTKSLQKNLTIWKLKQCDSLISTIKNKSSFSIKTRKLKEKSPNSTIKLF